MRQSCVTSTEIASGASTQWSENGEFTFVDLKNTWRALAVSNPNRI